MGKREWTPDVAAKLRAYRERAKQARESARSEPFPMGLLGCPQVQFADERGGWVAFVRGGRVYARVWSRRSRPASRLYVLWRP